MESSCRLHIVSYPFVAAASHYAGTVNVVNNTSCLTTTLLVTRVVVGGRKESLVFEACVS